MYRNSLYHYVTIRQLAILKIYTYRGVFDSGKHLSLVLMLLWEQLVFLVLGNSNLRNLLLAQYGPTVLLGFNYYFVQRAT